MKRKPFPYLLLALVLFMASCSKKTSNVPVPADAFFVMHISGSSFQSKLSWDEFKKGELYQVASENVHDSLGKKILDNPDVSGIDIKSDAFFFAVYRGHGGYAGFTCSLKDQSAFNGFMKKVNHHDISKEGDLFVIRDYNSVMTWNNERFVFIGDAPGIGESPFNRGGGEQKSLPVDSLVKFAENVYSLT